MKKIIFGIIGLIFGLSSNGQPISLSNVVNITPPQHAERLNREQLLSYMKDNFKSSKIPPESNNVYKIDGLVIAFWDLSIAEDSKKNLQDSKAELLEVFKRNKSVVINEADIKTINNISFLVLRYQEGQDSFIRFYSDYYNNKNITGIIQFKKLDEEKAQKALDDLLHTIHFKQ